MKSILITFFILTVSFIVYILIVAFFACLLRLIIKLLGG